MQRMRFKDMRVLVADGSTFDQNLLKSMIKHIGVPTVLSCSDGMDVLEILDQQPVDVIMSEWKLPLMGPSEFMTAIRASENEAVARIPVMIVTSDAKRRTVVEAMEAGASDFIVKPVSTQMLYDRLSRFADKTVRHDTAAGSQIRTTDSKHRPDRLIV